MSTSQLLTEDRHPEYRTNLIIKKQVQEGQKRSPTTEMFGYPWQEFQGLSWTLMDDEY